MSRTVAPRDQHAIISSVGCLPGGVAEFSGRGRGTVFKLLNPGGDEVTNRREHAPSAATVRFRVGQQKDLHAAFPHYE
jgi:hypothetical protein